MTIAAPTHPLYTLLGQSPKSADIVSYLKTDVPPTVKKVSKYIYHAYKSLGISLGFIVHESDELILDSIDVYNSQTRDGYLPFQQNMPCGLQSDMLGHQIVSLLGEPDKKGGGRQTGTPCWIEYCFDSQRDSGIVIQLHGFEWEDREMGWTSFVLY
ncbi:hypothetical protein BY458DRAFT_517031 [Sporodiniella umbellata]|nr:hypothetical protein BY458DRAFT_517031 [Sporodiniella umbellata]